MASVASTWKDEDGDEHDTDIAAALESLVDGYQTDVAAHNVRLPRGIGMVDFPLPVEESADND